MQRKYVYPAILLGITVILFLINFRPNTYLIGWDAIMPEFNFWLNLKRNLTGVWLSNRGLGVYDGQVHIANLIHTLFTGFLWFMFPENMIRYVSLFLLHLAGGLGIYVFVKKLIKNDHISFVTSLFYLFNIGTIQQFYAPLEVFAFHFAALPWLFYGAYEYIEKKSKRSLLIFFLISILATPQAFVPTIFIAFMFCFSSFLIYDFVKNKSVKRSVMLLFITLAINAFWLLPYSQGIKENAQTIKNSRINIYSSEDVYLKNKSRGDLLSTLSLQGFMMDTTELDVTANKSIKLMQPWNELASKPYYLLAYGTILAIIFVGIFTARKKKEWLPFYIPLGIAFFFIGNNIPVLREVNELLRNAFPLFNEAFRFPYTKFITIFVMFFSLFFAVGLNYLFKRMWMNSKKIQIIAISIIFVFIVILASPAFQGNFFSPLFKRKIPNDYSAMFDFFNHQDSSKRIALLPVNTFWSWIYRDWGYAGSDFLWFNIPQPLMSRAFDPWNEKNEQFYNEISYAVKSQNDDLFLNVLEKYQISYLLLDEHTVDITGQKLLQYDKLAPFIEENSSLKLEKIFGKIKIYSVRRSSRNSYISLLTNPKKVSPQTNLYYQDDIYREFNNYREEKQDPDIIVPFQSLFSEKTPDEVSVKAVNEKDIISLSPKVNPLSDLAKPAEYTLCIPSMSNESLIPVRFTFSDKKIAMQILYPTVVIDGVSYETQPPLIEIPLDHVINPQLVELTETNQKVTNNNAVYLFKGYPNTLRITNNTQEEFKLIDIASFIGTSFQHNVKLTPQSTIELRIPKIPSPMTIQNAISHKTFTIVNNKTVLVNKKGVELSSDPISHDTTELVISNGSLPHQTGYIMFAQTTWHYGLPLTFYIDNSFEKRVEVESRMSKKQKVESVLFMPPADQYHQGFGIHFSAKTEGNQPASTTLKDFSMYPISYSVITQLSFETTRPQQASQTLPQTFEEITPFIYKIALTGEQQNQVITFGQSYNSGWHAYMVSHANIWNRFLPFLGNEELKNHVLVNNWANGWALRQGSAPQGTTSILIVFMPQYLEYAGFIILLLCLIWILNKKEKA